MPLLRTPRQSLPRARRDVPAHLRVLLLFRHAAGAGGPADAFGHQQGVFPKTEPAVYYNLFCCVRVDKHGHVVGGGGPCGSYWAESRCIVFPSFCLARRSLPVDSLTALLPTPPF